MKKILSCSLLIFFSLLIGCEMTKSKEEVIEYFNDNYQAFENIQKYIFEHENIYFSLWHSTLDNTEDYVYLWRRGEWKNIKVANLSYEIKQYLEKIWQFFKGEILDISHTIPDYLNISLKNSHFEIVYLKKGTTDKMETCAAYDDSWGNITWNWYYRYYEYYTCEKNKKEK